MGKSLFFSLALLAPACLWPAAGASYLTSEPSARAKATGGALAASQWGIESMRYNPAGLCGADLFQAHLTHYVDGQFWTHDGLGLAGPLAGGNLGAEVLLSSIKPVRYYDLAGNEAGQVTAGSSAFSVGWARPLGLGVAAGVSAKYFGSHIDTYSNQGWAVDAGVQARLFGGRLGLGVSALNMGSQSAYIAIADPLPMGVKAGVEAQLFKSDSLALEARCDANFFPEARWMPPVQAGMEAEFFGRLALAAGVRQINQGVSYSLGGGLKLSSFGLSYAFQPDAVLGASHLFSLTMNGLPRIVPAAQPTAGSAVAKQSGVSVKEITSGLYRKEGLSMMVPSDINRAENFLAAMLEVDPKNPELYQALGVIAWHKEQKEKAMLYFRRALELDPGNTELRSFVEATNRP